MENTDYKKDLDMVLAYVDAIANNQFEYAKAQEFEDPSIAARINAMLDASMHRNNYFLARINDAQSRIAVNTSARSMLEAIESQRGPINELASARTRLGDNLSQCSDAGVEALALVKQIKNTVDAFAEDEEQIIRIFEDISEDGEATDEQYEKAVKDALPVLKSSNLAISFMLPRIKTIANNINTMFNLLEKQNVSATHFLDCVDSITGNYDNLYNACISTGKQLYRISRDIDEARNDMYRKNSWPLLHDRLKVFDVDHLTITWRLFNHLVEFENLKITQVNNYESCKFGKWIYAQTDSELLASEAYKNAIEAHRNLHDILVACYLSKEAAHYDEAIEEFEKGLEAYQVFHDALEGLHEYFRSIGITQETEVWTFGN